MLLHLSITFVRERGACGPQTYLLNIPIPKRATNQIYPLLQEIRR